MSKNKEETPLTLLSKVYPKLVKKEQVQHYKQFSDVIKYNLDEDIPMS